MILIGVIFISLGFVGIMLEFCNYQQKLTHYVETSLMKNHISFGNNKTLEQDSNLHNLWKQEFQSFKNEMQSKFNDSMNKLINHTYHNTDIPNNHENVTLAQVNAIIQNMQTQMSMSIQQKLQNLTQLITEHEHKCTSFVYFVKNNTLFFF